MSKLLYDGVTVTVEIGFSTSGGANKVPLGGTLSQIVWTDVTEWVRSVQTKRGRNSELDEFSTGTASIVLSNADRRFDPEYSSSPYFGAVTPGRPVRIRAAYSSTSKNLFFGWIDEWPTDYNYSFDSVVTVQASDAFKVLNQLTLDSFWNYTVKKDNPKTWLRLGEATGSSVAIDATSNVTGMNWVTTSGVAATGKSAAGLVFDSTNGAASFDGSSGLELRPGLPKPAATIPDSYKRTLEFTFTTNTTTDGSYGMACVDSGEIVMGVGMVVSSGVGTLKVWRGSIGGIGSVNIFTSTVRVNDDNVHHVVVPLYGAFVAPTVAPKVDNVDMTLTTGRTWTAGYDTPVDTIGLAMNKLDGDNFASPFTGVIDEFIVHSKTLTAADITAHYQLVIGSYLAGQAASARATLLLDMASWMSDARAIGTTSSTVQAIETAGKTVLDALKECEAAEQGRLFIDPDGKVKFIGRHEIATTTVYNTSQRTYGDAGSELPYSDIQFMFNDRLIANRVTVSKNNGGEFTVDDVASQGEYFIREKTISNLIVQSELFLRDLALAQVDTYRTPELRVESLQVKPRTIPGSLFVPVLSDDVGVRVTVKRRPQNVGSPISKTLILEGVEHSIENDDWVTRYSFSPTPVDYFILDSASFGVLDVNVLGY